MSPGTSEDMRWSWAHPSQTADIWIVEDLGTVGAPPTHLEGCRVEGATTDRRRTPDSEYRIWGEMDAGPQVSGLCSHPFSCRSASPAATQGWLEPRERRAPLWAQAKDRDAGAAGTRSHLQGSAAPAACRDRAGQEGLGRPLPPGSGKIPAGPTVQLYLTSGAF